MRNFDYQLSQDNDFDSYFMTDSKKLYNKIRKAHF